ncbi:unnamed protein product, partial [Brenthis ino]
MAAHRINEGVLESKMKSKIMAQRKFAQGANVPPSNSTTNTIVEKRTTDVMKEPRNVFYNTTSAKTLLDRAAFDSVHPHDVIVVRLERLKDEDVNVESDAVKDEVSEPDTNLKLSKETGSARNLSSKSKTLNVTGRKSLLKNSHSMFLRSGARINRINNNTGKRLATKRRMPNKQLPMKKRRIRLSRKNSNQTPMSWRLTSTDTDFSVDDDRPLTYFTRTANLKVSNQIQEGTSSKNNTKSGAMSKEVDHQNTSVDKGNLNQPGPSGITRVRSRANRNLNQPGPSGITRVRSQASSEEAFSDQHNSPDKTIFIEIEKWMESYGYKGPSSGTFKVPRLPARLRNKAQGACQQRGDDGNLSIRGSQRSASPVSTIAPSQRSASPISTIASDIMDIENEVSEPQPGTSSDDIDTTRRNSRERTNVKKKVDKGKLVDAPVFRPTPTEFKDPVSYFEKIMPLASKYGLCKVVAPTDFSPTCNIQDTIRFLVFNQYITRLYSRWGPATKELCTIRSYLASQKIVAQPPRLGGMEVNLAKLFHVVRRLGGLRALNKKVWNKVAEEVQCGKIANPDKRLDQLYVKHLVPYETLTKRERVNMLNKMDQLWLKRNSKMVERAANPLHRQKRLLGESDSSDEEDDEERYPHMIKALKEAEECITRGLHMNLHTFKRIAYNTFKKHFPRGGAITEVEDSYWSYVLLGSEHVCVNSASIDTGPEGYGFAKNEDEPYGSHPWNLKTLSKNNGNVLRLLGPVLGLTVPTLHLGMLYSTSCWHRDPHGLPWMEYMHQGSSKIWYGISDQESERFRQAVEILCPTSRQNKTLWLPSDITMIPPNLLLEHAVSLSRVVQNPGEFIIVFPKSYSSSICTGYTVSESVYFATNSWVHSINQVFQELRESCEPSMFSLEQILISAARDPRASLTILQLVHAKLAQIIEEELDNRAIVESHGLVPRMHTREHTSGSWIVREEDECEICRTALYISRVKGVFRRNGSLCLPHAIQVLEDKDNNIEKRTIDSYEFDVFFTVEELNNIISTSKKRLLNIRQVT